GFSVLIQSCRGTFGSGGELDPFRKERDDGRATLASLSKQPWFSGELATFGPSYLGFVQWALASDAGPMLKAMSVQITTSNFRNFKYPGESFSYDSMLRWTHPVHNQEKPFREFLRARFNERRVLEGGLTHLPLCEADEKVV